MPAEDTVKAKLRHLATAGSEGQRAERPPDARQYKATIERAKESLADLEAAADFVDDVGLDSLEAAVEQAETAVSACEDPGREALADYRALQAALDGDHFHPGHGSPLRDGAEPDPK